jgi:hypothetical protein
VGCAVIGRADKVRFVPGAPQAGVGDDPPLRRAGNLAHPHWSSIHWQRYPGSTELPPRRFNYTLAYLPRDSFDVLDVAAGTRQTCTRWSLRRFALIQRGSGRRKAITLVQTRNLRRKAISAGNGRGFVLSSQGPPD